MLLQLPALRRGRQDRHERAMLELHVSQSDADVLPEGLSLHESDRPRLYRGETSRPVLSCNHLSRGARATVDLHDHRTGDFRFHRGRLPRQLRVQCQRTILRGRRPVADRLTESLRALLLHQEQDHLRHAGVHAPRRRMQASVPTRRLLSSQVQLRWVLR